MDAQLVIEADYSGTFWFAEDPDVVWQGVLRRREDGLLKLHLITDGLEEPIAEQDSIVLGRVYGDNVRLDKCLGAQLRMTSADIAFERVAVARGEAIVGIGQTFRRTALWLTEVNGWIDHKVASFEGEPSNRTIKLNLPPAIVIQDADPRVVIRFAYQAVISPNRSQESTLLTASPFFDIKHGALNLDEQRWEVEVLQKFITLCTGIPSMIERVETTQYATDNDLERFVRQRWHPVWLFDRFSVPSVIPPGRMGHRYPVEFSALRKHWKAVYPTFRETVREYPLYIEALLAPYFNETMPDELMFSTLVFAAEGFHREVKGGKYMDQARYKRDYMRPLRALIPRLGRVDVEESISNSLAFCNQKSLRTRLGDYVLDLPEAVLISLFGDDDPQVFLRKIVSTRNYLAHREPGLAAQSFAAGTELRWGYRMLHALLLSHLLVRLGFPAEIVAPWVQAVKAKRHVVWGFFE